MCLRLPLKYIAKDDLNSGFSHCPFPVLGLQAYATVCSSNGFFLIILDYFLVG